MIKINLGCGTNKLPGWENYDAEVDITKKLGWPSDHADYIMIEHCVEHVTYHQAVEFFRQALRILKPGGVLRVTVPSMEQLLLHSDDEYHEFVRSHGWSDKADKRSAMCAMIFQHGHRAGWTASLMTATLYAAGFDEDDILQVRNGGSLHPELVGVEGHGKVIGDKFNELESMTFEATKTMTEQDKRVGYELQGTGYDPKVTGYELQGRDDKPDLAKDYDANFYAMHRPWQKEYDNIATLLNENFSFNSVVDFGCGNGYIINKFERMGKDVIGLDGSPHVLGYSDKILMADLTRPIVTDKCDMVICTEVAEHIDAKFADTLVDTVCRAATKDGTIFFSAAKAGHGGHHHVNEQERPYWYAKFAERGWIVNIELSEAICNSLRKSNVHTWWFANNCFVMRRATKRIAIVLGGAACWREDLDRALAICVEQGLEPVYYAVNDHIATFPRDVVACTLHPDRLGKWLQARHAADLPPPLAKWTHLQSRRSDPDVQKLADWGGSTGLFAYQVARTDDLEVLFCGVSMNNTNNFFRDKPWQEHALFRRAWETHASELCLHATSMSGWSKELLEKELQPA